MPSPDIRLQQQLVDKIRTVLANKPPAIQGAALAELLAVFIAGHHPDLREQMLTMHVDTVRKLVPPCEAELFSTRPRPKEWPPAKG